MIREIQEIPKMAQECLKANQGIELPEKIFYLGMGSSYFAALTLRYLGLNILVENAFDYFYFISGQVVKRKAVLISQSGRSSELLWCRELFEEYISISNHNNSPLSTHPNCLKKINIHAGEEKYSSTKTYINTLLTLYSGLGIHLYNIGNELEGYNQKYEETGIELAEFVFNKRKENNIKGIYIIGNGPSYCTALEASLILSETTKLPFQAQNLAQYDHGLKETAENTIVIFIQSDVSFANRTEGLATHIANHGAFTYILDIQHVTTELSPIVGILPFQHMAYKLANIMNIKSIFTIGKKVTET